MFAILAILVSVNPAMAWLNGGAENFEELQQIERLAKEMRKSCDIGAYERVSEDLVRKIARNLLFNETSCQSGNIAEWGSKAGEFFPSWGLVHAVWFPVGARHVADESFPRMMRYILANYVPSREDRSLIDSLGGFQYGRDVPAPWNTESEFSKDPRVAKLKQFLLIPEVLKLQAQFAVKRGIDAIYKILAANSLGPDRKMSQADICQNAKNLLSSDDGVLSLVDYVNWKGEGLHWTEVVGPNNTRWGLKQVLELMPRPVPPGNNIYLHAFADATQKVMDERAAVQPSIRKVMDGLRNRINRTYRNGGISVSQCQVKFTENPMQRFAEINNQTVVR